MALKPSPTPPTQTTTANLSPEQTQLMQLALPGIKQFAANVPKRYPGSTIAGLSPDQLRAMDLARGAAGTSGGLASAGAGALFDMFKGMPRTQVQGPQFAPRPGAIPRPQFGASGPPRPMPPMPPQPGGDFRDTRPPEERGQPGQPPMEGYTNTAQRTETPGAEGVPGQPKLMGGPAFSAGFQPPPEIGFAPGALVAGGGVSQVGGDGGSARGPEVPGGQPPGPQIMGAYGAPDALGNPPAGGPPSVDQQGQFIAPPPVAPPEQIQRPFGQNFWDPGSNPILQSAIGAATRPITENLRENILPALRSDAVQTGGFGGSRQGISEGMAAREAERAVGDTASKLAQATYGTNVGALGQQYGTDVGAATQRYGTDVNAATQRYGTDVGANVNLYNTDVKNATDLYGMENANQLNLYKANLDAALGGDRLQADSMLRSLGLLPTIQSSQMNPSQIYGSIGDVQQQQMQRYINENVGNFNYDQMAPFLQSKEIMSLMAGLPGGSNTTVGNLNPQNPFLAGLGGAATGAGLGSMFGPIGAGVGGLGGGLLGFLGTPK